MALLLALLVALGLGRAVDRRLLALRDRALRSARAALREQRDEPDARRRVARLILGARRTRSPRCVTFTSPFARRARSPRSRSRASSRLSASAVRCASTAPRWPSAPPAPADGASWSASSPSSRASRPRPAPRTARGPPSCRASRPSPRRRACPRRSSSRARPRCAARARPRAGCARAACSTKSTDGGSFSTASRNARTIAVMSPRGTPSRGLAAQPHGPAAARRPRRAARTRAQRPRWERAPPRSSSPSALDLGPQPAPPRTRRRSRSRATASRSRSERGAARIRSRRRRARRGARVRGGRVAEGRHTTQAALDLGIRDEVGRVDHRVARDVHGARSSRSAGERLAGARGPERRLSTLGKRGRAGFRFHVDSSSFRSSSAPSSPSTICRPGEGGVPHAYPNPVRRDTRDARARAARSDRPRPRASRSTRPRIRSRTSRTRSPSTRPPPRCARRATCVTVGRAARHAARRCARTRSCGRCCGCCWSRPPRGARPRRRAAG